MQPNISIAIKNGSLEGILHFPNNPIGLIIFAHGSGSNCRSVRNQYIAQILHQAHFATLLFDLLTFQEDKTYANRFDIDLISQRLVDATTWIRQNKQVQGLSIGYFGASTGSAAALRAAAKLGEQIGAVVSRGGRPDLVHKDVLAKVKSPTLVIVGGDDYGVIELNEKAYKEIGGKKKMVIVPGATHLFEEEGTMEKVGEEAVAWFTEYLSKEK